MGWVEQGCSAVPSTLKEGSGIAHSGSIVTGQFALLSRQRSTCGSRCLTC